MYVRSNRFNWQPHPSAVTNQVHKIRGDLKYILYHCVHDNKNKGKKNKFWVFLTKYFKIIKILVKQVEGFYCTGILLIYFFTYKNIPFLIWQWKVNSAKISDVLQLYAKEINNIFVELWHQGFIIHNALILIHVLWSCWYCL